jgi:ketosteroid isomerase-like protein
LVREGYAAWNRDDFEEFVTRLAPDVEWHSSGEFPGLEPVYHGVDGVREWWVNVKDPFGSFTIEPEQVTEQGDAIVTFVRFRAVGRESGVEVDLPFAHVFWFEGDLIVRYASFRTFDEALAAATAGAPTRRTPR